MRPLLNTLTTAALALLLFAGCPASLALANVQAETPIKPAAVGPDDSAAVENPALSGLQALSLGTAHFPDLPVPTKQRYKMVDVGGPTACAIRAGNQRIDCFGFNQFGQADPPKGAFKYISMGLYHGCALTDIGKMVCWGEPSAYPTPQDAKKRYKQISAGTDHTCARTARGELNCWGDNTFGELNVPPGQFIDVSAKSDHTCAIDKGHNLLCWGDKAFTSYGPFLGQFTDVSTGNLHVCALRQNDKHAVCWGNDAYGQASPPQDEFISLTSGSFHTCGQRQDKTTVCWGDNRYGQAVEDGRRVAQIAAGSNLTCILELGSRKLNCRGSFAFNNSLFAAKIESSRVAEAGLVRPQSSLDTWLSGGLDWFGSSLSDGLDTFYNNDLNQWVKYAKFGNIGIGLASFLISNLMGQEDPNGARFKEIQQELADIKVSLGEISQAIEYLRLEMASSKYLIAQLGCDSSLAELVRAESIMMMTGVSYKGPVEQWRQLLDDYQKYLTNLEQAKKENTTVDPDALKALLAKVENYRANWFSKDSFDLTKVNLENVRQKLTRMILGPTVTSPLDVCKVNSYDAWKAQKKLYPFDDRPIWQGAYKVFIKTMLIQDQIADIETGLNAFEMIRVFQGPRNDTAPIYAWEPKEGEPGVCRLAETAYLTGSGNQRLRDAWRVGKDDDGKGPCLKHTDTVKDIYLGQIKQFEMMGSAYSDDNVVLSMTSSQMGVPTGGHQSNWLWFRRVDLINVRERYTDMPLIGGLYLFGPPTFSNYRPGPVSPFLNSLPPNVENNSDYRLYLSPSSLENPVYGEYVWHSSGTAWEDAFNAREQLKLDKKEDAREDFMEGMALLMDSDPIKPKRSIFPKISKKPFWVTNSQGGTYPRDYIDMRQRYSKTDRENSWAGGVERVGLPCFMAEKINDGVDEKSWYYPIKPDGSIDRSKKHYLGLSGKVCTGPEFLTMLRTNPNLGWHWGISCKNAEECWGLGAFFPKNPNFDMYKDYFGGSGYRLIYQNDGGANSPWSERQWYWAETRNNMNLHHLPVVKITGIQCNTQVYASNIDSIWKGSSEAPKFVERSAVRGVGDGSMNIPSMCGNDLDRVINRYVPRTPYIDMPGIRTISVP